MQAEIDFTHQRDLSRGRHNENSIIAHERLKPFKETMRKQVEQCVDGHRCTLEIAEMLDKHLHKISGRFTALKASGVIEETGRKKYKGSTYTIYSKANTSRYLLLGQE